jgi:hypothetical protein
MTAALAGEMRYVNVMNLNNLYITTRILVNSSLDKVAES